MNEDSQPVATILRSIRVKTILLILFASLFVVSCTVEKRVHNRGWNIQWKKGYASQKGEVDQEEKSPQRLRKTAEVDVTSLPNEEATEEIGMLKNNESSDVSFDEYDLVDVAVSPIPIDTTKKTVSPHLEEDKENSTDSRERQGVKPHVTLFILALIAAVLSAFLLFVSLPAATDLFVAIIMALGVLGLALIALILFFVGLLLIANGA